MRISDWSSDVCSSDLLAWPKTIGKLAGRYLKQSVTERKCGDHPPELGVAQLELTRDLILRGRYHDAVHVQKHGDQKGAHSQDMSTSTPSDTFTSRGLDIPI